MRAFALTFARLRPAAREFFLRLGQDLGELWGLLEL